MVSETLKALLLEAGGGMVVDYGCHDWLPHAFLAQEGMGSRTTVIGTDIHPPDIVPEGCSFQPVDASTQRSAVSNAIADVVVCSHVIEHAADPIALFGDLVRIAKPGGIVYVEAPSELSVLPRSGEDPTDHAFRNFWDDPTHRRPWSPAALYRFALSFGAMPVTCEYGDAFGVDTTAILVARTNMDFSRSLHYRYVTLKNVPPGLPNAVATFCQHSSPIHFPNTSKVI